MNISTDSWHYRIVDKFADRQPSDLCSYMRALMLGFFVIAVLIVVGVVVGCLILEPVLSISLYLFTDNSFRSFLEILGILFG